MQSVEDMRGSVVFFDDSSCTTVLDLPIEDMPDDGESDFKADWISRVCKLRTDKILRDKRHLREENLKSTIESLELHIKEAEDLLERIEQDKNAQMKTLSENSNKGILEFEGSGCTGFSDSDSITTKVENESSEGAIDEISGADTGDDIVEKYKDRIERIVCNFFDSIDGISEMEKLIMSKKIKENQLKYQKNKRQNFFKMEFIEEKFPYLIEDEQLIGLEMSFGDEYKTLNFLSNYKNIEKIRIELARRSMESGRRSLFFSDGDGSIKLPCNNKNFLDDVHKSNNNGLCNNTIGEGYERNWSLTRLKLWKNRVNNSNAYYFRFTYPGEVQINGPWVAKEKELFIQRIYQVGINFEWGIFSQAINGRVGYQCLKFYMKLIERGEIVDPRFRIDENGKTKCIFNKKKRLEDLSQQEIESLNSLIHIDKDNKYILLPKIHSKVSSGIGKTKNFVSLISHLSKKINQDEIGSQSSDVCTEIYKYIGHSKYNELFFKYRQTRHNSKKRNEFLFENDEYVPVRKKVISKSRNGELSPPSSLPIEFKDFITNEELTKPAISPFGHVLNYSTWIKCLEVEQKNTCPFTKQHLKKRDLVLLTWENYEKYKDLIKITNY